MDREDEDRQQTSLALFKTSLMAGFVILWFSTIVFFYDDDRHFIESVFSGAGLIYEESENSHINGLLTEKTLNDLDEKKSDKSADGPEDQSLSKEVQPEPSTESTEQLAEAEQPAINETLQNKLDSTNESPAPDSAVSPFKTSDPQELDVHAIESDEHYEISEEH